MPLTILTDDNVKDVLGGLRFEDLKRFQESLRQALHKYSTGTQDEGACAMHQPERTVLVSPDGVTSLFMPSISSSGLGIKVVSLSTSNKPTPTSNTTPQGAITLMTAQGTPYAFVNASELTAFRTALASSLLIARRQSPKTLLVFGSGKQAYWHLRLSLILHGPSLKNIHVITRTLSPKAASLMKTLHSIPYEVKVREGWADLKIGMLSEAYGEYSRLLKEQIRAADIIFCTTPSREPLFDHTFLTNKEGRKKGRLIVAIGSYKPEMIEIPIEIIRQATKESHKHHHHRHAEEGGVVVVDTLSGCMKEAGEIIQSGISPYQLVELGELVILVSQKLTAQTETEVIDRLAGLDLDPENEGEASPRPSISTHTSSMSSSSSPTLASSTNTTNTSNPSNSDLKKKKGKKGKNTTCTNDDALCRWLRDGNVVYKSVGMGLMDLVVGRDVVELAGERGIGVGVEGF